MVSFNSIFEYEEGERERGEGEGIYRTMILNTDGVDTCQVYVRGLL